MAMNEQRARLALLAKAQMAQRQSGGMNSMFPMAMMMGGNDNVLPMMMMSQMMRGGGTGMRQGLPFNNMANMLLFSEMGMF